MLASKRQLFVSKRNFTQCAVNEISLKSSVLLRSSDERKEYFRLNKLYVVIYVSLNIKKII